MRSSLLKKTVAPASRQGFGEAGRVETAFAKAFDGAGRVEPCCTVALKRAQYTLRGMRGAHLLAAVVALLALGSAGSPAAHEIPRHVTVHAFLKPEGDRLRVLVRVPLAAMRDIQFPQRREGFLDIARSAPALRDAVTQWMLPSLEIFERGKLLPAPVIAAARVSLPSDRSFVSYDEALAHVTGGTLPDETQLLWYKEL